MKIAYLSSLPDGQVLCAVTGNDAEAIAMAKAYIKRESIKPYVRLLAYEDRIEVVFDRQKLNKTT